MRDYISVSQFNTYSRCQLQYYFRYILGLVVPPNQNMAVGTATHSGVEYAYQSIWEDNKYLIGDCKDVARDSITNEGKVEWVDRDKAVDNSVSMVQAYSDAGYPNKVKQEDIIGIEVKRSIVLVDKNGTVKPKLLGVADLVTENKVVDFKTSSKKQSKPDGYNYFQNSVYAYLFKVQKTEVHQMSYKKSGAEAVDYEVPIMPLPVLFNIVQPFWNTLKYIESLDWDKKDLIRKFNATGIMHSWACNYCGYGQSGICKHKMEV